MDSEPTDLDCEASTSPLAVIDPDLPTDPFPRVAGADSGSDAGDLNRGARQAAVLAGLAALVLLGALLAALGVF